MVPPPDQTSPDPLERLRARSLSLEEESRRAKEKLAAIRCWAENARKRAQRFLAEAKQAQHRADELRRMQRPGQASPDIRASGDASGGVS